MKICHIDTGKTWRGGQQQAFYLHSNLCKNGFDSLMICKKDSVMAEKCKSDNLPHKCLPLISEIDIYSAYKIARLRADILHLHDAHALTIGLWVKIFNREQKLIATRRVDFPLKKYSSRFKYNNNNLDRIVCVSQNIYNILLSEGILKEKLYLIHDGIDTQRYAVGCSNPDIDLFSMHNIPRKHLIIGTVAAYTGEKDYPTLLKAADIVLRAVNNVTFVALGDGKEKDTIYSLHSKLQLGNSFIFTGFVENVIDYLCIFDIFVLSSKMEGLGTAVLDAMSARKAVVACASGGIPEMVIHEVNGLLAEKENHVDLAEKILQLVGDDALRERLAQQAEIDVQKFSIQNNIEKNITLYNEICRL